MNKDIENEAAAACCAGPEIQRRTVLQGIAVMGGVVATGAVGPALAAGPTEAQMVPQVGDFIGDAQGKLLTPDDIKPDARPIKGFAVSPAGVVRNGKVQNQLLVAHFNDTDLTDAAKAKSAGGVFAYTAICTHAGCVINGWDQAKMNFACPCHGSHFDPKNNGAVVQGPANRKLPQLGLAFNDGKLTVTSAFDGRIGGDETQ